MSPSMLLDISSLAARLQEDADRCAAEMAAHKAYMRAYHQQGVRRRPQRAAAEGEA